MKCSFSMFPLAVSKSLFGFYCLSFCICQPPRFLTSCKTEGLAEDERTGGEKLSVGESFYSTNRAAPGLFLGKVRKTGGRGGDTISLLMEKKFLQIETIKYLCHLSR